MWPKSHRFIRTVSPHHDSQDSPGVWTDSARHGAWLAGALLAVHGVWWLRRLWLRWGFNQATNYVPSPPYYAIYPPVYCSSQITARRYGASPFAWSPGMAPITYTAQPVLAAAPQPAVIENPYSTSGKSESKQAATVEPAIQPLKIDNPFVYAASRSQTTASSRSRTKVSRRIRFAPLRRFFPRTEADVLKRDMLIISTVFCCAGCQSAVPLSRVWSVSSARRLPRPKPRRADPPNGTPAAQQADGKSSPARMSVSAEGPLTPATTPNSPTVTPRFASDPADRQPIRVVENPASTRTAAAQVVALRRTRMPSSLRHRRRQRSKYSSSARLWQAANRHTSIWPSRPRPQF